MKSNTEQNSRGKGPFGVGRRAFLALGIGLAVLGAPRLQALPAPIAEDAAGPLPSVVSGGADHAIKHWDTNGKLIATVGTHEDAVNALAFVPGSSGELLVSIGADGALKTWNLRDPKMMSSIDAHKDGATALAITSNGAMIATGGGDHHIKLWDRLTGALLADMPAHSGAVRGLHFTSDGAQLISGSADRMLRLWAIQPNLLVYQANIIAHDEAVTAVALSPDDKLICTVSEDGYWKSWRLSRGALANRIRVGTRLYAAAFSPDGNTLATGGEDGKIRLWNATTGVPIPFMGGHDRAVYALAWTADSKFLVSGGADNKIRYWNMTNGRQIANIAAHDGAVRALAIVP